MWSKPVFPKNVNDPNYVKNEEKETSEIDKLQPEQKYEKLAGTKEPSKERSLEENLNNLGMIENMPTESEPPQNLESTDLSDEKKTEEKKCANQTEKNPKTIININIIENDSSKSMSKIEKNKEKQNKIKSDINIKNLKESEGEKYSLSFKKALEEQNNISKKFTFFSKIGQHMDTKPQNLTNASNLDNDKFIGNHHGGENDSDNIEKNGCTESTEKNGHNDNNKKEIKNIEGIKLDCLEKNGPNKIEEDGTNITKENKHNTIEEKKIIDFLKLNELDDHREQTKIEVYRIYNSEVENDTENNDCEPESSNNEENELDNSAENHLINSASEENDHEPNVSQSSSISNEGNEANFTGEDESFSFEDLSVISEEESIIIEDVTDSIEYESDIIEDISDIFEHESHIIEFDYNGENNFSEIQENGPDYNNENGNTSFYEEINQFYDSLLN